MEDSASSSQLAAPTKRRKLHVSTIVFAVIVAVLLFLANLPGQIVMQTNLDLSGQYGPHFEFDPVLEHGWPFAYLRHDGSAVLAGDKPAYAWTPWSQLPMNGRIERVAFPSRIFANCLVAAGLLLGLAMPFEAWRRRRKKVYQLHVMDFLGLVVCAALIAVWVAHAHSTWRRENAALDRIQTELLPKIPTGATDWNVRQATKTEQHGPTWLRQLFAENRLRFLDRVASIDMMGYGYSQLSDFQHLRVIWIMGGGQQRPTSPLGTMSKSRCAAHPPVNSRPSRENAKS